MPRLSTATAAVLAVLARLRAQGAATSCSPSNDSCQWANDGECDEPSVCDLGTDCSDCLGVDRSACDNSCVHSHDGMCDGPPLCAFGTDCYDCGHSHTGSPFQVGNDCNLDMEGAFNHVLAGLGCSIGIGIVVVVATSLPLCCGFCKQQANIIAMVSIPIAIIVCLIPLFSSLGACDQLTEDSCSNCVGGCSDDHRDEIRDGCSTALNVLIYVWFGGWIGVTLGIVAASLGGCIFCKLCALSPTSPQGAGSHGQVTGMPVGAVMGQPVGAPIGQVVQGGQPPVSKTV